jgi:hypothetical protein
MTEFDVFISYSSKDKTTADAASAALENAGIRCWIAPRDILPGEEYGEALATALDGCKVMVLIFSASANASPQIRREVERVVSRGMPVVPLRIENVLPTKAMSYFVGSVHWLDALTPPLERHLHQLARAVQALLKISADETGGVDASHAAATHESAGPAPLAPSAPDVTPATPRRGHAGVPDDVAPMPGGQSTSAIPEVPDRPIEKPERADDGPSSQHHGPLVHHTMDGLARYAAFALIAAGALDLISPWLVYANQNRVRDIHSLWAAGLFVLCSATIAVGVGLLQRWRYVANVGPLICWAGTLHGVWWIVVSTVFLSSTIPKATVFLSSATDVYMLLPWSASLIAYIPALEYFRRQRTSKRTEVPA